MHAYLCDDVTGMFVGRHMRENDEWFYVCEVKSVLVRLTRPFLYALVKLA